MNVLRYAVMNCLTTQCACLCSRHPASRRTQRGQPATHQRAGARRLGGGPLPTPHHRDHVHGEVETGHSE